MGTSGHYCRELSKEMDQGQHQGQAALERGKRAQGLSHKNIKKEQKCAREGTTLQVAAKGGNNPNTKSPKRQDSTNK